LTDTGEDVAK